MPQSRVSSQSTYTHPDVCIIIVAWAGMGIVSVGSPKSIENRSSVPVRT